MMGDRLIYEDSSCYDTKQQCNVQNQTMENRSLSHRTTLATGRNWLKEDEPHFRDTEFAAGQNCISIQSHEACRSVVWRDLGWEARRGTCWSGLHEGRSPGSLIIQQGSLVLSLWGYWNTTPTYIYHPPRTTDQWKPQL